jgi:hypothetical protein
MGRSSASLVLVLDTSTLVPAAGVDGLSRPHVASTSSLHVDLTEDEVQRYTSSVEQPLGGVQRRTPRQPVHFSAN